METNKNKPGKFMSHYKSILLFGFAGVIAAGAYMYLAKPEYQSTVKLSVPSEANKATSLTLFGASASIATEEIKTADFLTKALENNAGLLATYISTDYRKTPSKYSFPYNISYEVIGNKAFPTQNYVIKPIDNKTYVLESTNYGIMRSKNGTFGQELIDNNLSIVITQKERTPYQSNFILQKPQYAFEITSPASKAIELITESAITVKENNGVLSVVVTEGSPYTAMNLADGIAQHYTNQKLSTSGSVGNITEIETIANQIAATEKEISKFKRENYLTEINADTEKNLSMLKDLQLQKTGLEVQLASLDNISNYLRKNRELNNSQVEYGAISDPAFTDQITALNQKYNEKNAGSTNPAIDTEIENLKTLIAERILNTRKKTAVQIDKVSEIIAVTEKNIARLPEQSNTLLALERKMQLDKKVYDLLIEKQAGEMVKGVGITTAGRIIAPATFQTNAIWPKGYLVISLGLLIGTILGFTISLLIHSLKQNKVNNRIQIAEVTKIPFLANISETNSAKPSNGSIVSNLCTAILMKPHAKLITFASSNKKEGKTFLATQLAQELAAVDKKVLLLDMNLNAPELNGRYSITADRTLSDVLEGSCDIHDAICLTSYPNLEILTAGNLQAGINTFLSSKRKEDILSTLKKHYDYIIIDTTETQSSVDAVAMMKLSDLNLYVVKANTTRKSSLVAAEQILADYSINEMYLVLNNSSFNSKNTYHQTNRTRNRKINVQRPDSSQPKFVPGLLKRIALWFY